MHNKNVVEKVTSLSLGELWTEFSTMYHDGFVNELEYKDCKYGLDSKEEIYFDIRIFIKHEDDERFVKIRHKSRQIRINGDTYWYLDFLDELGRRESIMRLSLIKVYSTQDYGRGKRTCQTEHLHEH